MRLLLALIVAVFCVLNFAARAETEWSDDQKQACMALLKEYPMTVEPTFQTQKAKDYWRKNLHDDKAIYFQRYSHTDAVSHGEYYQGAGWKPIYKAEGTEDGVSDVWYIQVNDRQMVSLSSFSLYIFINTSTKKIVTAWLVGGE